MKRLFARVACVLALILSFVVSPALVSYGQEATDGALGVAEAQSFALPEVEAAVPASPSVQPSQASALLYLPLVFNPPRVNFQFASQLNPDGTPINPTNSFGFGLIELNYSILIEGAEDQTARVEWTINGQRQPGLDDTTVIPANAYRVTGSVCIVRVGTSSCIGRPLDRGTYQVRVFLNDQLFSDSTATIQ